MQKPNFYLETIQENSKEGVFAIYPLFRGFGHTLGNVLRRVLMSSMEGAAVTYVKIKGVNHPFTTVKGLKEDALEIILNLKLLRFKFNADDEQRLVLKKKGPGAITAADIEDNPLCKVVNKDLYLGELASGGSIDAEIYVNEGMGYEPSEDKIEREFGMLPVDSVFTPVLNVVIKVEGTRVGRRTDYDKLLLTITTDGSIQPAEALKRASRILMDQLGLITEGGVEKPQTEEKPAVTSVKVDTEEEAEKEDMMVDELDLPTRVINALIKHGVETVGQLKAMTDEDLAQVRGLGKKSVEELKEKLLGL